MEKMIIICTHSNHVIVVSVTVVVFSTVIARKELIILVLVSVPPFCVGATLLKAISSSLSQMLPPLPAVIAVVELLLLRSRKA